VLTLFRQLDASVTRVAGWALQGVVALRRPEERDDGRTGETVGRDNRRSDPHGQASSEIRDDG
jgi:hypothetical protein